MSREIRSRGQQLSVASLSVKPTYRANWAKYFDESKPYNGFPWERFPHHCFPWLYLADRVNTTIADADREFQIQVPDSNGVEQTVRVICQNPSQQTVINGEMSGIVHKQFMELYGHQDLISLEQEDGVTFCRISAKRTPDDQIDLFRGVGSDFTVIAINEAAKTITVQGEPYYRKRATSRINSDGSPLYDIGSHVGFWRYERDQLTNDAERNIDDYKYREYDYTQILFGGSVIHVDKITDYPKTDQRIGAHPSGHDKYSFDPTATSTHTLRLSSVWPTQMEVGRIITTQRRLPSLTTMVSTAGDFGQLYGVFKFKWRFAANHWQFSSGFLWAMFRNFIDLDYPPEDKEMEIDVKENPGGGFVFHNTHRPAGGMKNYAEINNLQPVMDGEEWTEEKKQQHQVFIGPGDDGYVDPSKWHETTVIIWPPDNPYGRSPDSVDWYEAVDGNPYFTAGCILSPDAYNTVIDQLLVFLTNPVGGDFIADMDYFAPGSQSTNEAFPINFDIADIAIDQFHGRIAGGAGWPDPDGRFPNGMKPSFDDVTENSGTGVVNANSAANRKVTVSSTEFETVGTRYDNSQLLVRKSQ